MSEGARRQWWAIGYLKAPRRLYTAACLGFSERYVRSTVHKNICLDHLWVYDLRHNSELPLNTYYLDAINRAASTNDVPYGRATRFPHSLLTDLAHSRDYKLFYIDNNHSSSRRGILAVTIQ